MRAEAATCRRNLRLMAPTTADDPAAPNTEHRPIRTFHARRSRIRPSAKSALDRLWPRWGIDVTDTFDFQDYFEGRQVVLEIGCGMGDATLAMAKADPTITILAVDVHTPGLGVILRECDRDGLTNVRVASCDAVTLVREKIPERALAGIRIYFPDPWPKQRQHKRRLIQPDFVHLATSRLRPGGILHLATDWQNYAEQMLAVLSNEPCLRNEYDGFAPRPQWRPVTRFESRGLRLGHTIHDLVFTKV